MIAPGLARWHDDGFLIVRALLSPELIEQALREAIALYERSDLISVTNLRCRFQQNAQTAQPQLETFDPINDLSPACAELSASDSLRDVLSQLYGEPACLFKDKLIYKPPGCPGYQLHQDWIGWPNFPTSFLTVLIPLETSDRNNGCTIVYPGRHKQGCLSTVDGQYHQLPDHLVDESRAVPLELEPGDVAIFGGYLPHRSATNHSSRWRRQLYLSYNQESDGGQQRSAHYAEFHRWLRQRLNAVGTSDYYFQ